MRGLIIDDNFKLADAYRKFLEKNEVVCDIAITIEEAIQKNKANNYNILLIDVNLPDGYGTELLEKIDKKIPKIFITAREDHQLLIDSLENGADDYMIKPVDLNELKARIIAVIRRKNNIVNNNVIKKGNIEVNIADKYLLIDNEKVLLSFKEFEVFCEIFKKAPNYINAEEITSNLYDEYFDKSSSVLRVHIYNIKRKIKAQTNIQTDIILAEKHLGYTICFQK